MRTISAELLTPDAFAPFGAVLVPPVAPGRAHFPEGLGSARPNAQPSLSLTASPEPTLLPLTATRMERHAYSSQSFVPLSDTSFLVTVAPHGSDGRPDTAAVRSFIAEGGVGVTYKMDTWHHPLTVLRGHGTFAVWMWLDGTSGDEEFVDVEPFMVEVT